MPLVRSMGGGIWAVRTRLENRIARVLFVMDGSTMVLLHGFIKKAQATPMAIWIWPKIGSSSYAGGRYGQEAPGIAF
jgi:hypothetical protein